nr:hypothetical protein [Brachybacterium sp. sponge]
MEPFDLALGLGVAGTAVLLPDPVGLEQLLKAVASPFAAGEAGGEDQSVVGEGRGRCPVGGDQGVHRVDDHRAGERGSGAEVEQVAGVVVEEVEDLDSSPGGEEGVGDVCLPALVGQLGLEPSMGAAGAFLRGGGDEALGAQETADRGGRGGVQAGLFEVPGDGERAGVGAIGHQRTS